MLFTTMCASCHGHEGRGDGPSAAELRPPPRDFAARPWRFEPTLESIHQVILDGIPGTAMPGSSAALSPADVDALTAYVHELATARPPIQLELSGEARLLRDAGFIDLEGRAPPPLALADSDDNTMSLADLRGRPVLLHFWGTSCVHCLKEVPALEALKGRMPSLVVLHVCVDAEDQAEAQELLESVAPRARAWFDQSGLAAARFGVHSLPTTWLIDKDGHALGAGTGARDWGSPQLIELLETLANPP
jgi:thiol-disulfide isomerase/thioredoxin